MMAPVLTRPGEVLGVKQAAFRAGKNVKTIRRWTERHRIGSRPGGAGPLQISAIALEMVIVDDFEALELLRAGQRHDPRVIRYFDHLGISP